MHGRISASTFANLSQWASIAHQALLNDTPSHVPPPATIIPPSDPSCAIIKRKTVQADANLSLADLEPVHYGHRLAPEHAVLGRGTYGVVRLMKQKDTGQYFAVKSLDKSIVTSTGMVSQVQLEITAQRSVTHKNTVRCWNVVADDTHVHLILDYCCNGDLFRKLRTAPNRRLPEMEAFRLFLQLVSGLAHVHSLGFCHRDLKLENLLLDHDYNLKIADFGWVARINGIERNFNFCGTLDYLAPEMIRGSGHDWRVDIWAVGILLFELLAGKPPFLSTRHYELLARILYGRIHTDLVARQKGRKIGCPIKADALAAIKEFLRPDTQMRIQFTDILKLEWVQRMLKESFSIFLKASKFVRPIPPRRRPEKAETPPAAEDTKPLPLSAFTAVLSARGSTIGAGRAISRRGFSRQHKRAASGSALRPDIPPILLTTKLSAFDLTSTWGTVPLSYSSSVAAPRHRRVISPRATPMFKPVSRTSGGTAPHASAAPHSSNLVCPVVVRRQRIPLGDRRLSAASELRRPSLVLRSSLGSASPRTLRVSPLTDAAVLQGRSWR